MEGRMGVSTSGDSRMNLFPSGFDLRAWNPSGQVVPAAPVRPRLHPPPPRWIDGGGGGGGSEEQVQVQL